MPQARGRKLSSQPNRWVESCQQAGVRLSQAVSPKDGQAHSSELSQVLRNMDALIAHAPDLDGANFQRVSAPHPSVQGRAIRSFNMDRGGFAPLVMGWTGPTAFTFKLAYLVVRTAKLIDAARP